MNARRLSSSTPLDDFLAGAGSETDTGELLQRVGLIGSLVGITLATGLVVFLAAVHRGTLAEVRVIVRIAAAAGVLTVAGAATRIAGAASVLDTSWFDAMSSATGSASMMRLLAGVLIALGLYADIVPVGDQHDDAMVRWVPSAASAFGLGGVVTGVLSFEFDGHTVTEGPRAVHSLVNLVHVSAGSIWFGGVVGLAILTVLRRRGGVSVATLVVRFSSVATVAVLATAAAGALMSLMITDGFGDYTGTDWGRVLIVKTAIVAIVAAIGGYNHLVVVPALERDPDDESMLHRAKRTVSAEALLLLVVAVVTVFLATSSTN